MFVPIKGIYACDKLVNICVNKNNLRKIGVKNNKMAKLHKTCKINAKKDDIRRYLATYDSLLRLMPPWHDIKDVKTDANTLAYHLRENGWLTFNMQLNRKVTVKDKDISITDTFLKSPFPLFQRVRHLKDATQDGHSTTLEDSMTYTPPWSFLGDFLNCREIAPTLNRFMHFQHERICRDMPLMADTMHPKSIVITGAKGFVGRHLKSFLGSLGHYVTPISHKHNTHGHPVWNPDQRQMDTEPLEGVDTVIHLAGESLFNKRWSKEQKEYILENRFNAAATLASTIARCEIKPKTLIVASAIGYYGDAGHHNITEQSPAGEDFAADVCKAIESALKPAKDAGVRVVVLRFGVVLNPRGGALAKMLTPFKLCMGGPMGKGDQYMSWISMEDLLHIFPFILKNETLEGVFNATAPNPVTNEEFSKTLAQHLHRPCFFRMPKFMVNLAWGEMGETLLLSSARVFPTRLQEAGFTFLTPNLTQALDLEIDGLYPKG